MALCHFCAILNTSIDNTLQYSAWWTPFIYLKKVFPKEWNPGSASADMIRAILAHPSIDMEDRTTLLDQVRRDILFTHYAI